MAEEVRHAWECSRSLFSSLLLFASLLSLRFSFFLFLSLHLISLPPSLSASFPPLLPVSHFPSYLTTYLPISTPLFHIFFFFLLYLKGDGRDDEKNGDRQRSEANRAREEVKRGRQGRRLKEEVCMEGREGKK